MLRIDRAGLGPIALTIALTGAVACSPGAAPAVPTAAAPVATKAAAAASPVAAAVSPVATQVAAAASPAATSVAALASPAAAIAAAASPAAGTAIAASPVRITAAQLSPTDTTVTLQNTSGAAVSLAGWRLRVGTAMATLPGSGRVGPNEMATIHTAAGTSGDRDIYLGQEAAALLSGLQPGATVALLDQNGTVVSEFSLPRI